MKIFFYKSALCPRCLITRRELASLHKELPSLEIEEIDVLRSPIRAWKDGIKTIPALKLGENIITGFMLRRKQIMTFLQCK